MYICILCIYIIYIYNDACITNTLELISINYDIISIKNEAIIKKNFIISIVIGNLNINL